MSLPIPAISVVIPTFNRAQTLQLTLDAYRNQTVRHSAFEVIVVDDGSTDNTQEVLRAASASAPYQLQFHSQRNKGPGAARNLAIGKARAPLILIVGDDIIPHEDLLWEHLLYHGQHPAPSKAMLGRVDWDSSLPLSFFMHYITDVSAIQFGFHTIKDPENVPYMMYYTSNISLKTDTLRRQNGFHPAFIHAAYEDVEMGYRLHAAGTRLGYRQSAIGFHHHAVKFDSFCERQYKAGQMSVVLAQLHPELANSQCHTDPLEKLEADRKLLVGDLTSLIELNQALGLEALADGPLAAVPQETKALLEKFICASLGGYHALGEIDYLRQLKSSNAVSVEPHKNAESLHSCP